MTTRYFFIDKIKNRSKNPKVELRKFDEMYVFLIAENDFCSKKPKKDPKNKGVPEGHSLENIDY